MFRGFGGFASSMGGLWNYIQLFFVISGFVFLFKHQQELVCIKLMFVFCVWNGLVSILNTNSNLITLHDWFQFLNLPIAPCTLLIFYTISKNNQIKDFLLIVTIAFFIMSFLYYSNIKLYRVNILLGDEDAEMMTSDVYFLVGLLPAVLIFLNKKLSFIPILLLLFLTTLSGKRGAMVSVALMAFVYYVADIGVQRRGSIFKIILFVLLLVASVYLITYVDENYGTRSVDRLEGISEDGGSGRINIWARVLFAIGQSGFFQLLFGHGFNSIYTLLGMRAHNDFLDIFYCYGFISVVIFVITYLSMITTNIRMYKAKYVYAKIFTCALVYALMCSMVSYYFVDNTFIICGMFSCGLVLGDWVKYKKTQRYTYDLHDQAQIPN
jgi:hypothetical protein